MKRACLRLAALSAIIPVAAAAQAPSSAEPAWPPLTRAQVERIDSICSSMRRALRPEPLDKAETELLAFGAAAAPALIGKLSDHRDNINASLVEVLDAITTAEHAPLLARSASDKRAAVRAWVLRRLTDFHRPELAPIFRAARQDRDAAIAFQAALGLASAGDLDGMEEIFSRCVTEWTERCHVVEAALHGLRGKRGTDWLLARMQRGDERAIVAGLRLLRTVAERDAAPAIVPYLDHESHGVKKEAVNTLRVAIDGEAPSDELSVFQAIEQATAWKKRLQ